MIPWRVRHAAKNVYTDFWTRYLTRVVFVHINKTAGSSIEEALGLPFQHRTAMEFLELMGPSRFEAAYRFTFVRNPWSKVASHYRYRVKTNQTNLKSDPLSFNDWVRRAYGEHDPSYYDNPRMFASQLAWITDSEGSILVDFIGRYERLHQDFSVVARHLHVGATLPHLKSSSSRSSGQIYSTETAEIVRIRFADDIEFFGYEPPPEMMPS